MRLPKQKLVENTEAFVRGQKGEQLPALRRCGNRQIFQYQGEFSINIMMKACES